MPKQRLHEVEFVAMMAALVSLTAFTIDAMLPGMDDIAGELTPDAPEQANLVIPFFAFGMAAGTLFVGPLADAFGRRRVIMAGAMVYIAASVIGWMSGGLLSLLAARLLQGIAAAVPRIVGLAVVRDLYSGREMARILSFILLVFALVPAMAPAMSAAIMEAFGWRSVFGLFVIFSIVSTGWFMLRQGETLALDSRVPLNLVTLRRGATEILSFAIVRRSIAVQACVFAMLFSILSSSQVIFATIFDRADTFPYWFGLVAVLASSASVLNAKMVVRVGMRKLILLALLGQTLVSISILGITMLADLPFGVFFVWMTSLFFIVGLTLGNLNSLAMEPVGHIAGLAASVVGAISTFVGAALAIPVTLLFDGSVLPLALATAVFAATGAVVTRGMERATP